MPEVVVDAERNIGFVLPGAAGTLQRPGDPGWNFDPTVSFKWFPADAEYPVRLMTVSVMETVAGLDADSFTAVVADFNTLWDPESYEILEQTTSESLGALHWDSTRVRDFRDVEDVFQSELFLTYKGSRVFGVMFRYAPGQESAARSILFGFWSEAPTAEERAALGL